jgi:hypothetical protein
MERDNCKPLLLMIHGVNSTLEWSPTAFRVLDPHFRCQLVRYRYFHTPWGPVNVYIWPAALLLLIAYCLATMPHLPSLIRYQSDGGWNWTANLAGARGWQAAALGPLTVLLIAEAFIVTRGEVQWMKRVENKNPVWGPPVLFGLVGVGGAIFGGHPWQWVFPVAAITGVALFLDLREYSARPLSLYALIGVPCVVMGLVGWLVYDLFTRHSLTPSVWIMLSILALGIVEPFWRGNLAFAKLKEAIERAREEYPEPFVVCHSLGTYFTAHIFRETPQLRLGRVLFTGCVVDRRFPWNQVLPPARDDLISVSNYIGGIDPVSFATGILRDCWVCLTLPFRSRFCDSTHWLGKLTTWRPLGSAGIWGFRLWPNIVHTQLPTAPCNACLVANERAWVHNINHGWARHSTLNKDKSFQSFSWLPLLWGMSSVEFDQWLTVCRLGSLHGRPALDAMDQPVEPYAPQNPDGLSKFEGAVLQRLWSWPIAIDAVDALAPIAGRRLQDYVADILKTIPHAGVSASQIMNRLPKFVFDTVDGAWMESTKAEGEDVDSVKLKRLHPQVALRHAVLLAVEEQTKFVSP